MPQLTDPWHIGPVQIPNRVALAPLAGIGNWFVRLQAKRYGAGLAVSEMVSSFGIHYGNEKTCVEMLRIHAEERETGPANAPALTSQDDWNKRRASRASPSTRASHSSSTRASPTTRSRTS